MPRLTIMLLICGCGCLLAPGLASAKQPKPEVRWRQLQRGIEYSTVNAGGAGKIPVVVKDDRLHLVRITPGQVRFKVLMAAVNGGKNLTTARWASEHKLAVAINLGMYLEDQSTHVGYLRVNERVHSARWATQYKSLLALDLGGKRRTEAPALIKDMERPGKGAASVPHDLVVQNLRLIGSRDGKRGENLWSPQPRRWSEAAVAMDSSGRLLFLFCRAPLSMQEFNNLLLSLGIGVLRAMHMEGGPEASLSIHGGGVDLDLCGSFETGFFPGDSNVGQWPIPNVLGVAADSGPGKASSPAQKDKIAPKDHRSAM